MIGPIARSVLCLILSGTVATDIARAQTAPQSAQTAPQSTKRPKIGLVLSGGGARGFAHIGVLRVLQQLGIPVDVITATSMGAIAGGMYAAGYTPQELERVARTTDWTNMFSTRAARPDLGWRAKEDDHKNLMSFEIGVKDGGLTLPRGAVGAQQLGLLLRSVGGVVRDINDLARLPIPFAAMATDLATGRLVVLQKDVSLSTAMRASMSVPGAFAPVDYRGRALVDGALVRSLPVDIARQMGADVIIAVNAGTPLLEREKLTDVIAVGEQMINILTNQNLDRSLSELRPQDILITPALGPYDASDFSKGEAIIDAGAAAARAVADRLKRLAVAPAQYAAFERHRLSHAQADRAAGIVEIRVQGLRTVNPDAVLAELDLPRNAPVTTADVTREVQRIFAGGDFETVSYNLIDEAHGRVLVVTPFEKSWGYNTLRLGGNLEISSSDDNTFNLLLLHTWSWLNRAGGQWRNEVRVGEKRRLATEFLQPLAAGSRWFVLPRLRLDRGEYNLIDRGRRIARFEEHERSADLMLGYAVPRLGVAQVGAGWSRSETRQRIGSPQFRPRATDGATAQALIVLDTLDTVGYPRSGFYARAGVHYFDNAQGGSGRSSATHFELAAPLTYDRYTVLASVRGATSIQEDGVRFGGLFNLSGTPKDGLSGSRGVLLRGLFYRNLSDAFGDLQMPIYGGVSLEAATALSRDTAFDWSDFRRAMSLYFGAESPVGPLYFALGKTFGGSSALYFFWGRPQ